MRVIFIWKRLVCLLFLKPIIGPYWESWQRSFLGQQMQSKDYIRFFPLYFFWICLKMNLVLGPLHARISWCFVSVHPYMTIFLVCYYNIYNTAIIFPGINISDWWWMGTFLKGACFSLKSLSYSGCTGGTFIHPTFA